MRQHVLHIARKPLPLAQRDGSGLRPAALLEFAQQFFGMLGPFTRSPQDGPRP
jgi:hypothetical protein